MDRETAAVTLRGAAVGVAAALGGGVLYVPERVAPVAGPSAPLVFLLAGCAVTCLAAAFAVLVSGPFGTGTGLVYRAVSRTWESRLAGIAAAWPAVGAYIGLIALVANWLGYVGAGLASVPVAPGSGFGLGSGLGLPPEVLGALACALALAVHLLGPRRAATAVALLVWGTVAALVAALALAFVPGVGEFVPGNYDPLFPTDDLREARIGRLFGGVVIALFAFLGVESAASADLGDDRASPWATPLAALTVTLVTTLATFVSLGVVNWIRIVHAEAPTADALAAYLPLDLSTVTAAVSLVLAWTALVALGFPASRTLAGFAELLGEHAERTTPTPIPRMTAVTAALLVCYGVAAAVCLLGVVAPALYLAVPGLAVSALAVVLTAAALPKRRPDLWETCALKPGRRVRLGLGIVGVAASVSILVAALRSDPSDVLSWTLRRTELSVFGFDLVRDPLASTVPTLVAWELVGLGIVVVLRDYRESSGTHLPPLTESGREP